MKRERLAKYLPLGIVLLGAVLRLAYLGAMPGGMHQDEALTAWNAFAMFHEGIDSAGNVWPVYMAGWGDGQSALYVWLTVPLLFLTGGHALPFVTRLPQAVTGIFTLAAVYGIVKRLTGERKLALWSLFALAVCPWHIMMNRWGLEANLAPGFLIFGLYFFVRGLEEKKFLPVSAFFYGLSLYCYAVVWLIVPVILLLEIGYGLWHKKLRIDRVGWLSAAILFVMALPLMLFVLVNQGVIEEIRLPFMTIPSMSGYRGGEVAGDPRRMWINLRTALSLLWHQNTGAPYDVLLPWGLFYDIGRVFIVIGAVAMTVKVLRGLWRREYTGETFLFIQLLGGGILCLFVAAVLHQINALYIPLVLCEGYGIWKTLEIIGKRKALLAKGCAVLLTGVYLFLLAGFTADYYTEYREVVNAYFGEGIRECVDYAVAVCGETGLDTITVEKAAQWPRLLLYTETLPSEYLKSVVYDVPPAPASFRTGDLMIRTRIDYDRIDRESVYILYFIDREIFEQDFELTKFEDWYVAVPR
ncbi:MAG: glycosyltransferase family 39 protein [Clostridium sp.]|nr:glycosyltransferase family 39 protein [Acetatifactor muris]MCM1525872.1 glycosyltransferase family 39 protein [Bacteroides sp.]MCM1562588.1 glycosyltransferase family 39 protein [Clostridium sp.]